MRELGSEWIRKAFAMGKLMPTGEFEFTTQITHIDKSSGGFATGISLSGW